MQGKLDHTHPVAIKIYNYKEVGDVHRDEALMEVKMLKNVRHPNVVICQGIVEDNKTERQDCISGSLVMEWVGEHNLYFWLQKDQNRNLGLRVRLKIARQVRTKCQFTSN
jgi:serine/threonine protein kinase